MTLRTLLLAALLPLVGCLTKVDDTGVREADTDTDADADTDTDTDADTGIAQFYFLGDFATSAGEFSSAHLGYGLYGLGMDDWACTILGAVDYEGTAPGGCPDCDWSFDLSAVHDSVTTGDYCDQFGFTDGAIDGYLDYSWGFADTYYYDYNGSPLPLEDSILLYYDGAWTSFGFNYNSRTWVDGDAESLSFARPAFNSGAYVYYYYYPY